MNDLIEVQEGEASQTLDPPRLGSGPGQTLILNKQEKQGLRFLSILSIYSVLFYLSNPIAQMAEAVVGCCDDSSDWPDRLQEELLALSILNRFSFF